MRKSLVVILCLGLLTLLVARVAAQETTALPVPSETAVVAPPGTEPTAAPANASGSTAADVTAEATAFVSTAEATVPVEGTAEVTDTMAYVRAAHFSPDTGAVDIFINGQAAGQNIAYTGFSDWMAVNPGSITVSFSPTGSTADQAAATGQWNLQAGTWTTIAAVGLSGDQSLALVPVEQKFDRKLPGTGYVTFFNAVVGGPHIDIIRNDVTYVPELFNPTGDTANKSWFGILDDIHTPYTFRAVETGSNPVNVLAELPETQYKEADSYLIALVGSPNATDNAKVQLIVNDTPLAQAEIVRGKLQAPGTIIQALQADPRTAGLADAIDKAGLTETLSGAGPFTVFAPADFALDNLPEAVRNDPKQLAAILQYHVVQGDLRSQQVTASQTLNAVSGGTLTPSVQGDKAYINDAQIIDVNIPATNGVIHIINKVLTPGQ
jgi:uncharacterized surface protein with fasciclin (FAS1) repeats